jgi:chromosome segregation ATPase
MKNIFRFFALYLTIALICTGCQMGKVERLEKENEQLKTEIIRSDSIQTQFMNAYSEIEYNLSEIRAREKSIDRYSNEPGVTSNSTMQEKILDDIAVIGRLLEDNRVKLANMQSLQKQLAVTKAENARLKKAARQNNITRSNGSSRIEEENRATQQLYERQREREIQEQQQATKTTANNASNVSVAEVNRLQSLNESLQNTITQLRQQVAESEARIEALQEELSLLKEAYAALQAINESLQSENSKYKIDLAASKNEIDQKNAEIARLNEAVQTAFYYIGSKKDATAKGLLVAKKAPVYKDADFIRIENIFEKKIIETKSAKPIIASNHPSSSYSLDTKDKENVKIVIKDPNQFWKITKYLIITTPK